MRVFIAAIAGFLTSLLVGAGGSALASTVEIDITPGRSLTYGIAFDPHGAPPHDVKSALAAQSFVAPGARLLSASMPLRELNTDEPVAWEFQLYDDSQGRPSSIIARFGSFDPGVSGVTRWIGGRQTGSGFERYEGQPATPIPLVPGQVYYLGIGPKAFDRFNNLLALGDCFTGNNCGTNDLYPLGNSWVLNDGVPIPSDNDFDFNMTITFESVPEPSPVTLSSLGLVMLGIKCRPRREFRALLA